MDLVEKYKIDEARDTGPRNRQLASKIKNALVKIGTDVRKIDTKAVGDWDKIKSKLEKSINSSISLLP
jgi:hypothetical protein